MAAREAPPWKSWTREQWQAYRDRHVAACARPGWEAWAENVGHRIVAMCDYYLNELEDSAACRSDPETPPPCGGSPTTEPSPSGSTV